MMMIIIVVDDFGMIPKGMKKRLRELEIRGQIVII